MAAATPADANAFTVGCVNCGAFHYGGGRASTAAFEAEWKRLADEWAQDVFMFEDVGRDSRRAPGAFAVPKLDIRASARNKPAKIDVVTLPRTIDVDGKPRSTPRYRALRLVFDRGGRSLAVYGVHLVAESHLPKGATPSDGPSPSQKLRQLQFKALMEDARAFDHAILSGDFNAQKPWEYDVFAKAGYSIANCSAAFGTHATLRNIPADNVVVSPGLSFADFKVLKSYVLDTDHFPLVATIRLAN